MSSSLPATARKCLNFLRSEPFCLLLAHLTGLDLVKDFRHHFPQLVTRYTEKGMSSDEPIELLSSDEEEGNKKPAAKNGSSQPVKDTGDLEKHGTIKMVSTKQGTEGQVLSYSNMTASFLVSRGQTGLWLLSTCYSVGQGVCYSLKIA